VSLTSSTTVRRSFPGVVSLPDGTVPATVEFDNGSVRLYVVGDAVGSWPRPEVDFRAVEDGYELHAEGDFLRFVPEEASAFEAFLSGGTQSPMPSDPPEPPPISVEAPPIRPPRPIESHRPEPRTTLEESSADVGAGALLPPLDDRRDEPSGLLVDTEPDEYFAAGLDGPPPAPTPTPPPPATNSAPRSQPTSPPEPPAPAAPPQPDPPPSEEPSATQKTEESAPERVGAPTPSQPPVAPGRLSQLVRRAESPRTDDDRPARSPEEVGAADDDTPEALSDAENLRQWGIVIAGAVLVVAILGMAAWAVINFIGGEEPNPETDSTTPVTSAPPLSTTTTAPPPPPTTVPPENAAAAATFVEEWNAIASQYGYHHLTIGGEALPLSTAPVPAVHLVYDESGVLELSMAPKGSGSDRDILFAMGIAVAWADPSLSPEGRRDVLGALGVDVQNPTVSEMGGELDRNGISYSIAISNDVLRFRVQPAD